ncbi:MAG: hypothetical protein NTX61_08445 [Bacteroidetes bacterium]|nr:hypothetical protein [Bacteroidota bacterium]
MINLEEAKRIGILYAFDDVPMYNVVSDFVSQLQQKHKEVKALGFVRNKNLISRFLPKLSYDFFSKKDINWFFIPIHSKVKDFIGKEFDILIDLSLQDTFPLKYISGLSRAFCRVGKYSEENTDYYDLLFEVNSSLPLNDYIKQITHYLTVINHDTSVNH